MHIFSSVFGFVFFKGIKKPTEKNIIQRGRNTKNGDIRVTSNGDTRVISTKII